MPNTLLDNLRECWEPSGGVMVGRQNNLNLTNVNGATVDVNGLNLVAASQQYAQCAHNVLLQFDGDYTAMATFKMASFPNTDPLDPTFQNLYRIMSKGGGDPNVNPPLGYTSDYYLVIEGSQNNSGAPNSPAMGLYHTTPTQSVWGDTEIYYPHNILNQTYVLFSYFNSAVSPQIVGTRLYCPDGTIIDGDTLNIYDDGSYHTGLPLALGSAGGYTSPADYYNFFDGIIARAALWGSILTNAQMDSYYNGGTPLAYSSWQASPGGTLITEAERIAGLLDESGIPMPHGGAFSAFTRQMLVGDYNPIGTNPPYSNAGSGIFRVGSGLDIAGRIIRVGV